MKLTINTKLLKSILMETITDVIIIWLPIDLLYLYFDGAWSDPNRFILIVELIILPLFSLLGIWRVIKYLRILGGK